MRIAVKYVVLQAFKLLSKNSIWHAHFFSPNNKCAIKHNSWCIWTAHRYLTTSQTCQKHATCCFFMLHNRKCYLHDGLISQSTQHLFKSQDKQQKTDQISADMEPPRLSHHLIQRHEYFKVFNWHFLSLYYPCVCVCVCAL